MTRTMADAVSRFVPVNGTHIHYRAYNPEDVAKPGLIFIHGMWAHARWWDHIAPQFTERYRVIAVDLAGMGDSQHRSVYTVRGFAEDILAVQDDGGLGTATLVAHSFGGNVASFACHLRPGRIDRAILIDTHLYIPGEVIPADEALEQARVKARTYPGPEEAIARYRLVPKGGQVDHPLLDHVARAGLREDTDGWRWKFDTSIHPLLADDPGRELPGDIRTPVDLIYGGRSPVVSSAAVTAGRAFFSNCGEPVEIADSGHHVLLEKPAELVCALRGLLARPAAGPG